MFEFYHTRNIVRDWLGVVERKKKEKKKEKKEKGRTKREEYVILLEKKKWYNDKVRKSALTYFPKKTLKLVKECWGFYWSYLVLK